MKSDWPGSKYKITENLEDRWQDDGFSVDEDRWRTFRILVADWFFD